MPASLGGERTLNDATGHIAVCTGCNTGPLSLADRELAERSYLSVIASQRLDSSLWQAWDIFTGDHNELLEARAVWDGREISHFHHRPRLH
ncbi:MAG: hypothetical protein ABGY75_17845, partial [Gemmataceae bacterium]